MCLLDPLPAHCPPRQEVVFSISLLTRMRLLRRRRLLTSAKVQLNSFNTTWLRTLFFFKPTRARSVFFGCQLLTFLMQAGVFCAVLWFNMKTSPPLIRDPGL